MNSSGYGLIKMVSFYAKLLLLSTNRKLFFACFSPFYAKKGYQKILLMYKKVFYLEKIFKMRYSKCLYLMKQKSNSNFRKKKMKIQKKILRTIFNDFGDLLVSVNHLYLPIFTINHCSNLKCGKS